MNTARIVQAAYDIETNTSALEWLEEYGVQIDGRDPDDVTVKVHIWFASSLPGSKEAEEVISAFAALEIPALVQTAIRNCRNTIEMARAAIAEEAARVSEPTAEDLARDFNPDEGRDVS